MSQLLEGSIVIAVRAPQFYAAQFSKSPAWGVSASSIAHLHTASKGPEKPLGKFNLFRPQYSGEPCTKRKEDMRERGGMVELRGREEIGKT